MKPASDVVACIVDNGDFVPVARRLALDFKKTYYWSPWDTAFSKIKDFIVGDGFEEMERVESIWEVKDKCDLFVFTDIGHSGMQNELISQGYPVWGARDADGLESQRGMFLRELSNTNLPIPKYKVVSGTTNLRLFLKDEEDKYLKISTYRGDFETFHWRDWSQDEGELDQLAVKFGPTKEHIKFYVFDPIETEIEDGSDTWCIDGKYPETIFHGMEAKDKAYIITLQKFDDLPKEVRVVNEEFASILEKFKYRGAFSTEVRITKDGESFFIDPTCRFGSPPCQSQCEMLSNWGEIVWGGANGEVVEPESTSKFGVQALIKVDRSDWAVMDIPKELDQWVKFSFSCRVNDKICIPPEHEGICEIGWLVAVGDTIDEAIDNLRDNQQLLPSGVTCEFASLVDLLKEIHAAEDRGMEFTPDEVPEPATVIE
jgi:hypothetical protein